MIQAVKAINRDRMQHNPLGYFTGKSCNAEELADDPTLMLDFLIARPQMALYQKISARIVNIYLNFVSQVYGCEIDGAGFVEGLTAQLQ